MEKRLSDALKENKAQNQIYVPGFGSAVSPDKYL